MAIEDSACGKVKYHKTPFDTLGKKIRLNKTRVKYDRIKISRIILFSSTSCV